MLGIITKHSSFGIHFVVFDQKRLGETLKHLEHWVSGTNGQRETLKQQATLKTKD